MGFGDELGFDKLLSQFGPNVSVSEAQISCRRDDAPLLPPESIADDSGLSIPPIGVTPIAIAPGEFKRRQDGAHRALKGRNDQVEIGHWFKMPKNFYESGLAARLRPSDQAVYVALLYRLNSSRQKASNRVTVNDKELAAECGVKPRTIKECRTRLCEAQVISTSPGRRGKWYTYTIPPPSFEVVPVKERQQRKRQPRAMYAKRKPAAA